jgi:DNA-directed RNA polymerase alpha subunit
MQMQQDHAEATVKQFLERHEKCKKALHDMWWGYDAQVFGLDEATYFQMMVSVKCLNLSARPRNCLMAENIQLIGDLVQLTETDLLARPHLGKVCLKEIKEELSKRGLALGREPIKNWPK